MSLFSAAPREINKGKWASQLFEWDPKIEVTFHHKTLSLENMSCMSSHERTYKTTPRCSNAPHKHSDEGIVTYPYVLMKKNSMLILLTSQIKGCQQRPSSGRVRHQNEPHL